MRVHFSRGKKKVLVQPASEKHWDLIIPVLPKMLGEFLDAIGTEPTSVSSKTRKIGKYKGRLIARFCCGPESKAKGLEKEITVECYDDANLVVRTEVIKHALYEED